MEKGSLVSEQPCCGLGFWQVVGKPSYTEVQRSSILASDFAHEFSPKKEHLRQM